MSLVKVYNWHSPPPLPLRARTFQRLYSVQLWTPTNNTLKVYNSGSYSGEVGYNNTGEYLWIQELDTITHGKCFTVRLKNNFSLNDFISFVFKIPKSYKYKEEPCHKDTITVVIHSEASKVKLLSPGLATFSFKCSVFYRMI